MTTLPALPARGAPGSPAAPRRRRRRALWPALLTLVISAGGALAVLALGLLLAR
jgi:hypothetical protein